MGKSISKKLRNLRTLAKTTFVNVETFFTMLDALDTCTDRTTQVIAAINEHAKSGRPLSVDLGPENGVLTVTKGDRVTTRTGGGKQYGKYRTPLLKVVTSWFNADGRPDFVVGEATTVQEVLDALNKNPPGIVENVLYMSPGEPTSRHANHHRVGFLGTITVPAESSEAPPTVKHVAGMFDPSFAQVDTTRYWAIVPELRPLGPVYYAVLPTAAERASFEQMGGRVGSFEPYVFMLATLNFENTKRLQAGEVPIFSMDEETTQPGNIIMPIDADFATDRPLTYMTAEVVHDVKSFWTWCNKPGCELMATKKCARCLEVHYCGPTHQRWDWKHGGHKQACIPTPVKEEPVSTTEKDAEELIPTE